MSAPDPEELARKTLDLWQDQLAALAGDPEAGAALARLMTLAAVGPAAAMQAFAEAIGGRKDGTPDHTGAGGAAPGTAAAGAPSRPGEPQLADLERRLAAIEARLAELERVVERPRPGPGRASRKGRSRSPR